MDPQPSEAVLMVMSAPADENKAIAHAVAITVTSTQRCPSCHSQLTWKDGVRRTNYGAVQRYLCRECGFRFSDGSGQVSYISSSRGSACQIGANPEPRLVGNLVTVEPLKDGLAGATKNQYTRAIQGRLVDFAWWMKKQGYRDSTARKYPEIIGILARRGANIFEPDSVKEVLAQQEVWSVNRKHLVTYVYTTFLRFLGQKWDRPPYRSVAKLPFNPNRI